MIKFRPGQVVKFTYHLHTGRKEAQAEPTDDLKEVFVLHPMWDGRMHGIDLKRLTAAEKEVMRAIFDPKQRGKRHRFPLVNDILARMNPVEEVKNPMSFYSKFVKVFLRNKDAYRTYYPLRMLNVVVSEQTEVTGKVINPKPLFHNVESVKKPEPTKAPEPAKPVKPVKPMKPVDRLALLRQRQAALSGEEPEPPPPKAKPADRLAMLRQRQAARGKPEIERPQVTRPPRPK